METDLKLSRGEIAEERKDREERLRDLEKDWEGKKFDDVARAEYNQLNADIDELDSLDTELERRETRLAEVSQREENVEPASVPFQTRRPGAVAGNDIWDLSTITRSYDDPGKAKHQLDDRGKRAIERSTYPHPDLSQERAQEHLERIMYEADTEGDGKVASLILATGSDQYKRAFTKYIKGQPRTSEEEGLLFRAMSLTGASGGVAVPFVLDPTLLPSYNGAVNPFRAMSDVRTISVDEWRGVTSGGITAAFQAEAAATTDQSPTLASVSISTEMARVNIPYSIEIGMDWSSFSSDMAAEIQNAKDVLEATKFAVGSGTNEPFGVVTGATTLFTSSDSAALFSQDIYGWHDALPPLYRSRAKFALNNATLSRIRQLDTAGGSAMLTPSLQVRSSANVGSGGGPDMQDARTNVDLFGKPVYEASGIATFADNALIGVFGAFDPYYKIIDRIGLTIVDAGYAQDATTGFPTGQKFLLAYWRVGAKVVAANAFRTLRVA